MATSLLETLPGMRPVWNGTLDIFFFKSLKSMFIFDSYFTGTSFLTFSPVQLFRELLREFQDEGCSHTRTICASVQNLALDKWALNETFMIWKQICLGLQSLEHEQKWAALDTWLVISLTRKALINIKSIMCFRLDQQQDGCSPLGGLT